MSAHLTSRNQNANWALPSTAHAALKNTGFRTLDDFHALLKFLTPTSGFKRGVALSTVARYTKFICNFSRFAHSQHSFVNFNNLTQVVKFFYVFLTCWELSIGNSGILCIQISHLAWLLKWSKHLIKVNIFYIRIHVSIFIFSEII